MALLHIAEPGQSAAPHQHRLAAGIDLGTTNSLVATVRSGEAQTLPDRQGQPILPSVVRYTAEGIVVGEAALAAAVNDAVRKVEEKNQKAMSGLASGMGMPPGFKMPF